MPAPIMSRADWVGLVTLSALWGGSFFFVEIAVEALPPLTIVLTRVGLAALALACVITWRGAGWPRGWRIWGAFLVMGALNNAVPFTLFAFAQGQITSGLAAILNATTPLFGVLVAHVATTDERLTTARLLGVVTGFAGVVVMIGGGLRAAGVTPVAAQAACLLAALSYALAGVWGRRFRRIGVAPLATAFGQLSMSSLILLPLVVMVDRPWGLPWPGLTVIAALVGLALISTALAYLIYFRLLASAGATNLLLVTLLIPVSATLLGVGILDETLAPRHILGMAFIAAGLLAIDGRILRRHHRR